MIQIGDRIGKLTVIQDSGKRFRRHIIYSCQCDCGGHKDVVSLYLSRGHTSSCGCTSRGIKRGQKHAKYQIRRHVQDKIGVKINKLTLVAFEKTIRVPLVAVLQCECGCVIKKPYVEFKKGKIKSCGCIRREQSENARIKKELKRQQLPKPRKPKPPKDFTGLIIGKITVSSIEGNTGTPSGKNISTWHCQCKCGKELIKSSNSINNALRGADICGCDLYEDRKNRAINASKQNKKRLLLYLKDEWSPRDDEDHKHRRMKKTIKTTILEKCYNVCVICNHIGTLNNQLCTHHYKAHALYPKLRYLVANQVILCEKCHNTMHKKFGWENVPIIIQAEYIKMVHNDLLHTNIDT